MNWFQKTSQYSGPERREFHGIRDKVDRGLMSVEDARASKKPEPLRQVALDPYIEAARMKMEGIERQESWSRWIQRTSLRPGMDAKDWYAIYDSL